MDVLIIKVTIIEILNKDYVFEAVEHSEGIYVDRASSFKEPRIGYHFYHGTLVTGLVKQLTSANSFKTLTKHYMWEIIPHNVHFECHY